MADRQTTPDDMAARLRQLRGDRSLKGFAAELGVDQAEYIGYETARREIPASLLVALIERGAVDPAWVLTGQKFGTLAQSAKAAAAAYAAILEAAQRADVALRLATINGNRLP